MKAAAEYASPGKVDGDAYYWTSTEALKLFGADYKHNNEKGYPDAGVCLRNRIEMLENATMKLTDGKNVFEAIMKTRMCRITRDTKFKLILNVFYLPTGTH